MSDALTRLFEQFDRGTISRRQLLQGVGIAALGAPFTSYAQGRCGGENRGTAACDTTPAKLPFDRTGWKTVLLDHFELQCVNAEREAAYYQALMNWIVRSADSDKIVMDIGELGSVVIRGGYQPPAAPAGGGGGGGVGRVRNASWTGFAWGIEPWDTKKVESELKKRGLNPVAEHSGRDVQGFRVTAPDGFSVKVTNGTLKNRRVGAPTGRLSAPAPFESTTWKTVWLDHISYESPNYKASVAFYTALLGWTPSGDEGSQNTCRISDTIGGIIIRGGGPPRVRPADTSGGAAAAAPVAAPPRRVASIGHISFGLEGFDYVAVKAELDKRGLNAREDTGGPDPIATARYKSYHTTTPDGFDLQISNTVSPRRGGESG